MVGAYGGIVAATLLNSVMLDIRRTGTPVSQNGKLLHRPWRWPFQDRNQTATSRQIHPTLEHRTLPRRHHDRQPSSISDGRTRRDVFTPANILPNMYHPPQTLPQWLANSRWKWIKRYDYRFVNGGIENIGTPKTPLGNSQTRVWIADKPPRPLDYLSLAALADCFFLRLLQIRGTMEPMGTVTLTTPFPSDRGRTRRPRQRPNARRGGQQSHAQPIPRSNDANVWNGRQNYRVRNATCLVSAIDPKKL